MSDAMNSKLAKMSALLREQQEKAENNGTATSSGGDHASYMFWLIPNGSKVTLRFLPDGNTTNPFFWVPREIIKLPFAGQIGGDYPTDEQVIATVPCVDMFGKKCPIIAATKSWWNNDKTKPMAQLYYKKRSYLFQGFVANSPIEEKEVPENPIRRFVINPSIYKIIKESLTNPEMSESPDDFVHGRDFTIKKTKQGDFSNYSTSTWSLAGTRALSEAEHIAIQQYGLFDLSEFLGPVPDTNGIALIKAMFEDSYAGKPFDFDSYGHAYRAYADKRAANADPEAISNVAATVAATTHKPTATTEAQRPSVSHNETADEVETVATPAKGRSPADVLASIKNRAAAAATGQ